MVPSPEKHHSPPSLPGEDVASLGRPIARHPVLFACLLLLAATIFFFLRTLGDPKYESTAKVQFKAETRFEELVGDVVPVGTGQPLLLFREQPGVVRSPEVVGVALEKVGVVEPGEEEESRLRKVKEIQGKIEVSLTPPVWIRIDVTLEDPDLCRSFMEELLESYKARELAMRAEQGRSLIQYLDERSRELDRQMGEATRILESLDRIRSIEGEIAGDEQKISEIEGEFEKEIVRLESERGRLLLQYPPESRQVRTLDEKIAAMREVKTASDPQSLSSGAHAVVDPWPRRRMDILDWVARDSALREEKEDLEAALVEYPAEKLERDTLLRDLGIKQGLYESFQGKKIVLEQATPEIRPSVRPMEVYPPEDVSNYTRWPRALLESGVVGLAAALILVYFVERMNMAFLTRERLERELEVHVLGEIPFFSPDKNGVVPRDRTLPWGKAPGIVSPDTAALDAYRLTAVTLLRTMAQSTFALLVTSSFAQEGKSTTCANLARAVASLGSRVVLVNANLRRPSLEVTFGMGQASAGLVNHLLGECSLEDTILTTAHDRLWFLPSGKHCEDSSQILSDTKRLEAAIGELRGRFDIVIFDSPPSLLVADAFVIAPHVDAVALVYQIGVTHADLVRRAVRLFRNHGVRLAGVVVNEGKGSWYGYSYRYGYRRRYYSRTRYYGRVKKRP